MTTPELRVFFQRWFCRCGAPDDAAKTLLALLDLHPLFENGEAFEALIPDTGMRYLTLYSLDHFGLTEHGGSIGGGWLTKFGEQVREALREADFGTLFDQACIHGQLVDHASCPECAAYIAALR